MELRIQDPFDPNTKFLLEALLEGCQDAIEGAGAFAFASAAGIKLLFNDPTFEHFINAGSFKLVVGLDAITNNASLNVLQNSSHLHNNLVIRAFHHNKKVLFHPKVCWFKKVDGNGVLISGSGNLTVGGLKGNWEAFSVNILTVHQMLIIEQQWNEWVSKNSKYLKDLTDPSVVARASQNTVIRKLTTPSSSIDQVPLEEAIAEATAEVETEENVPKSYIGDQVLIATIGGGNRWKQANFTRDNFHSFFGANPGTQQRLSLYYRSNDGTLGEIESRPVVSVKSNNHRLELGAAAGIPYPVTDRPIGIFLRVATRTFHYMLLMPDDIHYQKVKAILNSKYSGPRIQLPRVVLEAKEFENIWPESPLWQTN